MAEPKPFSDKMLKMIEQEIKDVPDSHMGITKSLMQNIVDQTATIERLRDALEKYADGINWQTIDDSSASELWNGDTKDGYEIARQALDGRSE